MKILQAVLAVVLLMLTGCGQVNEDLTNKSPYNSLVGKQFKNKVELVVYRYSDSRKLLIQTVEDILGSWPRSAIKPPFPMKNPDGSGEKIFGILPPGTEFKVVKIKDEGNTGFSAIHTYVEIIQSSDPQWVGKVVSELGMTTYDRHINLVPKFKPDYMEELPRTP